MTPAETLADGRLWFAKRPQFFASQQVDDHWRCKDYNCQWDKGQSKWVAWTRKHPERRAETPAAALALVGYVDPVTP